MGRRSSSPRHVIAVLSALVGTEQGVTPVGEDGHDELQALADGMKGQSVAHMTRSSSAWYAALEEGAILRFLPGDVVSLCPPLVISPAEIDSLFDRLTRALDRTLDFAKRERLFAD